MKRASPCSIWWLSAAMVLWLFGSVAAAVIVNDPDPNDAFEGATIVRSSATLACCGGSSIHDMFGAETAGTAEPGRTLFETLPAPSDPGAATTYTVDFQIAASKGLVNLRGFTLYDLADGAVQGGARGVSRVNFLIRYPNDTVRDVGLSSPIDPPDDGSPRVYAFGEHPVDSSVVLTIVYFSNADRTGPRIIELDAITVPEPAGLPLAGATLGLLVHRRCHGRCPTHSQRPPVAVAIPLGSFTPEARRS